MYHHQTLKKYVVGILNFLNELEVQYKDSKGNLITANIPFVFTNREKTSILNKRDHEQLLKGNLNVLPRGALSITAISRNVTRQTNKNNKINIKRDETSQEYQYNSVAFDIMLDVSVMCRGMNEAAMVVEQVLPMFNPNIAIDVFDGTNQDEPTRVPVQLLDISIEPSEFEETSINIATVNFGLQLGGYFYQPVKKYEKIKEYITNFNDFFSKSNKVVLGWDVNDKTPEFENSYYLSNFNIDDIVSITPENDLRPGKNMFKVEISSNRFMNFNYDWNILEGDEITLEKDKNNVYVITEKPQHFIIECKVDDGFGCFKSLAKEFVIHQYFFEGEVLSNSDIKHLKNS